MDSGGVSRKDRGVPMKDLGVSMTNPGVFMNGQGMLDTLDHVSVRGAGVSRKDAPARCPRDSLRPTRACQHTHHGTPPTVARI